jgi:hypothetical protein
VLVSRETQCYFVSQSYTFNDIRGEVAKAAMAEFPKYRSATLRVSKGLFVEVVGRNSGAYGKIQIDRVDAQRIANCLLEYAGARAKSAARLSEGDCGELVFGVDRLQEEHRLGPSIKLKTR